MKSELEGPSSSEIVRGDPFMEYGEVGVGSVAMKDILHKEMEMWCYVDMAWRGRWIWEIGFKNVKGKL